MMELKEFTIPFSGLKDGKHAYQFKINNTFFESFGYSEFNDADLVVEVELMKRSGTMELSMDASGEVNVNCDLTNEPFDQEISSHLDLVVKFGEQFNNEDDEILILPHGEHQVNIGQYVYEMLVLAVPAKKIHPGVEDGTLQSDVLSKLEELRPNKEKEDKKGTDPRWDALKNLLTDN